MYPFFVYILSDKTTEKSITLLIASRDRFIYLIIILICGFGLLECLFFAFFPRRLVAQTLHFSIRGFFDILVSCRHIWIKRDINGISIHAELQPSTRINGEGDAKQIKTYSATTGFELRRLWKDIYSRRKNSQLRFRTVLLFPLRWQTLIW